MKKLLVFATFLTVSVAAHAEALRVHLSQNFATTGTMLPAGEYTVSPLMGSTGVLMVQGNGLRAFVFGRVITTGAPTKISLELSKDKSMDMKLALALSSPTN